VSNSALFLGIYNSQLQQAALLYQGVAKSFDPSLISFTGHSLGGGLAGLMAVYFDRPAVTFDTAPFRSSLSAANAQRLKTALAGSGVGGPAMQALDTLIGSFSSEAARREAGVSGSFLQGEALQALRALFPSNTIGGASLQQISMFDSPLVAAPNLSMAQFVSPDEVIFNAPYGLSYRLFYYNRVSGEFRQISIWDGTYYQVRASRLSRQLVTLDCETPLVELGGQDGRSTP